MHMCNVHAHVHVRVHVHLRVHTLVRVHVHVQCIGHTHAVVLIRSVTCTTYTYRLLRATAPPREKGGAAPYGGLCL